MLREAETITVTDLRVGTREILENAHFRGRRYIVERAGQRMAVIMGIEDYQRLLVRLGDLQLTAPVLPPK